MGYGSRVVTAAVWVAAVAWVQSLAKELTYAARMAEKKKRKEKKETFLLYYKVKKKGQKRNNEHTANPSSSKPPKGILSLIIL